MESKNYQRRFFRLDNLDLPAKYKIVGEKSDGGRTSDSEFKAALIKDLSAGGLSYISEYLAEAGAKVQVVFQLPNINLSLLCEIVRIVKAGSNNYNAAVRFISVDEAEQDKIMSFIFRKQLELRRRGLR